MNFWYYFSKKNKNFKKICFDEDELKNKYRFTFNKDNFLSKEISDSLSYNGIVVIENVLGTESLKTLRSIIDQLNYNFDKSIINLNQKKFKKNSEDKKRERIVCDFQDINIEELDYICEKVSELFYGKKLIPTKSLYIDKCFDVPEAKIRGDNLYILIDFYLI